MENRLAIVDFAFGCEAHHHVLIQESRVGGRGFDVASQSKYLPWPRAYDPLRGGRCKGSGEPTVILQSCASGD